MCSYCVPNLFAGGRTLPYAFGRGAGGHRGTGIPQTLPTKEERERETHMECTGIPKTLPTKETIYTMTQDSGFLIAPAPALAPVCHAVLFLS